VRRGEIEGRIDVQFHAENPSIKDCLKLGEFVKIKGGKRIPKGLSYSGEETDFWYLRVDDIDAYGNIKSQNLKHISAEIFEALENYELKPNEIVISIAGTIGKITLLDCLPAKRIILTENCAKLQIKSKNLSPKFLAIILSLPFVQKQMALAYIRTTIPKLGLERIYNLKIPPIPSPEIQTRIIEKFEAAYNAKRAKESQAESLHDGVDAYLLERLGMRTPIAAKTKKTFFVRYANISGNRFDASAYRQSFNYDSSKFQVERLSKIAFINPKVTFEKLDIDSEISFVPMEVINEHEGAIEELRSKKVRETKGFSRFREGDLIWAKITPCMQNGKSAVARNLKQGFACGSTEFYVIRPRTKAISVDYLHFLLRNKRVLENARNFFGGSAGQQRVSVDFLKNFQVPVPPIEIQEEIAAHIQSIRARVKELEREAQAEVERAKAEVERMILGEVPAGE
jgi:type I restriction enzyme S subunit